MVMSEIRPPSHYGEWFVFQPIFHVDGLRPAIHTMQSRFLDTTKLLLEELEELLRLLQVLTNTSNLNMTRNIQKWWVLAAEFRAQDLSVELNIQQLCAFSVHPGFLSGCNRIRRSFTFAYPALHSGRRCQQINRGPSAVVGQSENIFKFL